MRWNPKNNNKRENLICDVKCNYILRKHFLCHDYLKKYECFSFAATQNCYVPFRDLCQTLSRVWVANCVSGHFHIHGKFPMWALTLILLNLLPLRKVNSRRIVDRSVQFVVVFENKKILIKLPSVKVNRIVSILVKCEIFYSSVHVMTK